MNPDDRLSGRLRGSFAAELQPDATALELTRLSKKRDDDVNPLMEGGTRP